MRLLIVDGGSFFSCDSSIEIGTMMTINISVTPIPIKMARLFLVAADGAIASLSLFCFL